MSSGQGGTGPASVFTGLIVAVAAVIPLIWSVAISINELVVTDLFFFPSPSTWVHRFQQLFLSFSVLLAEPGVPPPERPLGAGGALVLSAAIADATRESSRVGAYCTTSASDS